MPTTDAPFRQTEDLPPTEEMHRAFFQRDASYEGVFWVGVRTTGIFCRPTCPARKPNPENVRYLASTREALSAGYRPCRRCRPMEPRGAAPEWIEGLLGRIEEEPARRWRDADLRDAGFDPARVRRWFKRHHGMTFHAYQRARRLGLALGQIRDGDDIVGTAYDHGYESVSGFREAFEDLFGVPPGRTRTDPEDDGDGPVHAVVHRILTPVGPLLAGATEDGLCLLEYVDRRILETQLQRFQHRLRWTVTPGTNRHVEQVRRELGEYFASERTEFEVSLVLPGTEFQRRVWAALREIPHGEIRSYEEVARAIGRPGAARAVGRANGANRIPIVVPCHRVVRADGSLGGYGGEVWRKRYLLRLEGRSEYGEPEEDPPPASEV